MTLETFIVVRLQANSPGTAEWTTLDTKTCINQQRVLLELVDALRQNSLPKWAKRLRITATKVQLIAEPVVYEITGKAL